MRRVDHKGTQVSRRAVVGTGVKLAYTTPILAASFKLTAGGALANDTCTCPPGAVADSTPFGGGSESLCCSCEHCKHGGRGGHFGDVIYPGAFYHVGNNLCASTRYPNGFSTSYCAPICTPCQHVSL